MAPANRRAYAILGLLAQGPKTGYEITRQRLKVLPHMMLLMLTMQRGARMYRGRFRPRRARRAPR